MFFFAQEHWWLSQAFRVTKHPSRRCLCTVQHRRDCSWQCCKTLCYVLLSSQLKIECSVLIRQSTHPLLRCSQRIFHLWMFARPQDCHESIRTPEPGVLKSQTVSDLRVTANELHTRPKNRVPRHEQLSRDFTTNRRVPQLAQRLATLSRDHQRDRQPDRCQQGMDTDSTELRYHVCRVSALCPVRNSRSHSNQSCATHMMNVHVSHSLSMSRPVYRLKASAVQVWHVDGTWLKKKRERGEREKMKK